MPTSVYGCMTQDTSSKINETDTKFKAALELLKNKRDGACKYAEQLKSGIDKEHKHKYPGTTEEAYWEYGYAIALKDAVQWLEMHIH